VSESVENEGVEGGKSGEDEGDVEEEDVEQSSFTVENVIP